MEVKRFASWVMLTCLISIQAHHYLPHHHHAADTAAYSRLCGFGDPTNQGEELDGSHPEISPHDEPYLDKVGPARQLQLELVMALPSSVNFVLSKRICEVKRMLTGSDHPYAIGPPGRTTSRAPPVSVTA